ncbi:putative N-acetyltransferase YhdJ [Pseudolycoriella hygida]|uniref:N-acetyltransferase YhdJ n=1 Tax=Pseudolycoriella hygida TaxID=35572 RepID=A0A9Q0NB97_9DIPT|nr:putative N-acetyltransferase YhdJ [Pseudolycoriella hygida]
MGFRLVYIRDKEENRVASICGFRITHYLFTGKTLYIDDLCTLPFARGRGHGRALLNYTTQLAEIENCHAVSLDSGYTRNAAHRLYLNCGFDLASHHFMKKLS